MFRHAFFALVTALAFSLPAIAQDYTARTADPAVDVATLKLQLKPLQLSEVEAEAKAWIAYWDWHLVQDWAALNGSDRFRRVVDKRRELRLPLEAGLAR